MPIPLVRKATTFSFCHTGRSLLTATAILVSMGRSWPTWSAPVLYVPHVSDRTAVRAWRPEVPGVREVFHARFDRHAYPSHTHDVWTVLIVDAGDIRFALDGRDHGSATSSVTVLPPHVAHDGRAGRSGAFVKRVLYLDGTYLGDDLIGHAVDQPTLVDPSVRSLLATSHRALGLGHEPLAAEGYLSLAAERLSVRLRRRTPTAERPTVSLADATRDLLDEAVPHGVTLQELAGRLGVSRGHLVRTFTRRFGVAPHAYLTGRRVDLARGLLLDGMPAAAVAAAVGFHDQPHLHRHFVRHVGTTPGRYARQAGAAGRSSLRPQ